MTKNALLLLLLLLARQMNAQVPSDPEYTKLVEKAYMHLQSGECRLCLDAYNSAFERSRHSPLSHFRAATCALACQDTAQCIQLLGLAVGIDWEKSLSMLKDRYNRPKELNELLDGPFGQATQIAIRQTAMRSGIHYELMEELTLIRHDDQKYRIGMDSVISKHGRESAEFKQYAEDWLRMDSLNMAKIDVIIQKHGYPGKSLVGAGQASTAWLVIQHAPLAKQEQYLPLIEQAANAGECRKADWAYLVDRVAIRKKLPQIYGSQVSFKDNKAVFYPIADEANVNKRRADVGLGPLEEYAKQMGVEWELPK